MNLKEFIKDYLSFSRRERIGVLTIVVLMVFIIFLPEALKKLNPRETAVGDTSWFSALRNLEIRSEEQSYGKTEPAEDDNSFVYQFDKTKEYKDDPARNKSELFFFDPNTISAEEWKKLGLKAKTIQTIQNYLGKGGRFNKAEDLQKIYGLHKNEFERLEPYIRIESNNSIGKATIQPEASNKIGYSPVNYSPRYKIIDINMADTTELIALPGIGSKLAARIVSFREKLGGFYAIEQVGETYGLYDSTFQKIKQYLKLENPVVKKININTATVDELKAHPYIKYSLANPIIAYRNEHGKFSQLEDLKKIMTVTDEIYKKISPYLFVQ